MDKELKNELNVIHQEFNVIHQSIGGLSDRTGTLEKSVAGLKKKISKCATKDDIRMVIDHIDSYFVRGQRVKTMERKVENHEQRLLVLEQR